MTAVVWWKEYRQQRWLWATILILAAMLVVALAGSMGRESFWRAFQEEHVRSALWTAVMCLGLAYGVACGALLLAGEKEDGTQTFLDRLSPERGPVWHAKLSIGFLLTLAMGATLSCLGLALGFLSLRWAVLVPLLTVDALVWGLLGGAIYRKVFPAVLAGTAFLGAALLMPLVFSAGWSFLVAKSALAFIGGYASWKIYSTEDRAREVMVKPTTRKAIASWMVLGWLMLRQGRWILLGGVAGSIAVGLLLNLAPLIVWPIATWLIGVTCGLAVFAPDQGNGQSFWGAQRFPLGRVWTVKILVWASAAILLTAILWGVAVSYLTLRDTYLGQYTGEHGYWFTQWCERGLGLLVVHLDPVMFLGLSLVYGFAFGQFFSLVCRRAVIGAVLAGAVGGFFALAWLPSVFGGGLALWQVLPIPFALLLATRLAIWPWVSGRLYTRRPMLGMVGISLLALGWLGGNLWYRVAEVPDVGEPFDMNAYLASIPSGEKNEAGRLIRESVQEMKEHLKLVEARLGRPTKPIFPQEEKAVAPALSYLDFVSEVLDKGWPKDDREISLYLDQVFQGRWVESIRKATQLPLGTLVDPRVTKSTSPLNDVDQCRLMYFLFLCRSYQLQGRGDSSQALEQLKIVLALSRQLRSQSPAIVYFVGSGAELVALTRWTRWLNEVGSNREALRQGVQLLEQHGAQVPPAENALKAEFIVFQNSWPYDFQSVSSHAKTVAQRLVERMNLVPWETERQDRIVAAITRGQLDRLQEPYWIVSRLPQESDYWTGIAYRVGLPTRDGPDSLLPATTWGRLIYSSSRGYVWTGVFPFWIAGRQAADQRTLRAVLLTTALADYLAHESKPANSLGDLVPKYLKEIPRDPVTGKPFQYRVSKGEEITGYLVTDRSYLSGGRPLVPQRLEKDQGLVFTSATDDEVMSFLPLPVWKRK